MVDAKRLSTDAIKLHFDGSKDARRDRTGATDAIARVLPTIRALRDQDVSWAAIAAALARQGVVQGRKREPLTAQRLTSLIDGLDKREKRRAARKWNRRLRVDLAPVTPPALADELSGSAMAPARKSTHLDAEQLRRDAFDSLKSLMRKDQ